MPNIQGKREPENPLTIKNQSIKDGLKSHDRRRAVKLILGGMGVLAGAHVIPEKWTKPLIDCVVLPVHAQTTVTSVVNCSIQLKTGSILSRTVTIAVEGDVMPASGGIPVSITASAIGGQGFETSVHTATISDGTFFYDDIIIRNGPGITAVSVLTVTPDDSADCYVEVPILPGTTTPAP